jgi:hypothetical protein
MTDQWVPGPPNPIPPPTSPGLPPSNSWNVAAPCTTSSAPPSITGSIILTDRPATIVAVPWRITVNDGGSPPNFTIDQTDSSGNVIDSPIEISGVDGSISVLADPTQPLGVATKQYVDNNSGGIGEAPMDSYPYARYMATWERLPQAYIPEAPNTSQRFGRFNSTWQLDAIQTDAASDGNAYGRINAGWGTVLPTTGGTITGSLTVNQVLTVQGSNSMVLNAPLGGLRAILGMAVNVARWSLALGDSTGEGLNNVGANFTLSAYSTTGAFLGNWLTIARADGSTAFNGSGVTIAGGLAVNGLLALAGPSNLAIFGGTAGQFLSTNGSGILSWATPAGGGGGITDAPIDGTAYARKSAAWSHLAHTDITDWTATLAPYALTTSVPVASTTTPVMDGTAAVGVGTTWARADHVHPSDTSRYAASNPSGYQTAAQVAASTVNSIDFTGVGMTPGPGATGAVTVGGILNVANGGMGSGTHVLNGVLIGAGTNAVKASAAAPGAGALLIGAAAAVPTWLGIGATNQLLTVVSGTPAWTTGIPGTTTNDNALPGQVGELISSAVSGPGVTLTTGTAANVTSISLTSGDWDVRGEVWMGVGTGGATSLTAGIATTNAAFPTQPSVNSARSGFTAAFTASVTHTFALSPLRMSLGVTTTVYLLAQAGFPSGTTSAYGVISARRRR